MVLIMRHGEVQQVFIYLMVIIVVGAIMLIGYNAIYGLIDKKCDVELATFRSDLRSDLQRNSNFGSSQSRTYNAPCDYVKICFVEQEIIRNGLGVSAGELYPAIYQEVSEETGRNIFLIKDGVAEDINFAFEGLAVPNGYVCISVKGGSFEIRMKGITRGKVEVSA